MKFTPEVISAIETLRKNAENDFELHRISVLEKDLTAPPVVEVIDDKYQKFNDLVYCKTKDGHFYHQHSIHRDIWNYYNGKIPHGGYEIHHKDFNPAHNHIENLQLLSKVEHVLIHKPARTEKICPLCRKKFQPQKVSRKYCSRSCAAKANNAKKAKPLIEKTCPVCGKKFTPFKNRDSQVCCSLTCSSKLRWQKIKQSHTG